MTEGGVISTKPKRRLLRWSDAAFVQAAVALVLGLVVLDAPASGRVLKSDDSSIRDVIAGVPRSWPPQYSVDENGDPTGFAIDIMEEIAARAGLRVGYRIMDSFAEVSEAMNAGHIDLIPNSGITPKRAAEFAFTAPVETFVVSIFIRDDTLDIRRADHLRGHRVGVVEFNIGQRLMRDRDDIEMVVYRDAETALFSLVAGHVDAMVFPQPVLLNLARQVGIENRIAVVGVPLREIKRGIRVQKGETELLAALNQAVNDFVGTPAYQAIYVKWYGRPEPFWTDWRVLAATSTTVLLVLIVMAWWRYHSVIRLNRALQEAEERFRTVVNNSPTKIHIKDTAGRYVLVNREAEKLFGVTDAEARGKASLDIFPKEQAEAFQMHDKAVLEANHAIEEEEEWTREDGVHTFLTVKFPIRDVSGKVIAIGAIGTDITERKKAEESSRQLIAAINTTNELVTLFDADDRLVFCNERYREINSAVPENLIPGITFEDQMNAILARGLVPEAQGREDEWLRERLERHRRPRGAFELSRQDGIWLLINEQRLPDGGVITLATDITERKVDEERLRQAQKMEAVGQLTGGVAHDFNNLLAVILGQAELLEDRLGDDDPSLRGVIRAATRGAQLTQRLLAFSRRQALEPEAIDLNALIAGMMDLLRRTLGETIEIELLPGAELWNTLADPGQVENALLNLAINARDAMPEGGKLIVIIDNVTLGDADANAYAEAGAGDYVRLSVADTGIGMSAEVRERALEPFFTTKDVGQGSGLGLPMVYGFVRQSGGFVSIDSEQGRGTTVAIYLPRARIPERQPEKPALAEEQAGRGETILVVEDDPDVRQLTATMLASLGYQVIEAADGNAALEMLNGTPAVELMLSDVVLSGGMSGLHLADEAKRRHTDIKVLFMSGYVARAIERQPPEVGAGLLKKPFRRRELAAKVRAVFDGGSN